MESLSRPTELLPTRNSVPLSMSVINRAGIEASSEIGLFRSYRSVSPGLFVTEKESQDSESPTEQAGTINIRGVGTE